VSKRARIAAVAVVVLAGLQIMRPRGTNPPVDPAARLEAQGAVPAPVLATLRRGCYDCHSSETRWPWYTGVIPAAWLVVSDVEKGRGQLNWSRWRDYNVYDRADLLDKACEMATKKRMPPGPYLWMHGDAKLNDADVQALCAWKRSEAARITGG
jgi:hypothetical protein